MTLHPAATWKIEALHPSQVAVGTSSRLDSDDSVLPLHASQLFLISTLDSVKSQLGHWRLEHGRVGFKCKKKPRRLLALLLA